MAASVAPAAAAGAVTSIEQGPIGGALLSALETSADQPQIWDIESPETVAAPQHPAGDGPTIRQHSPEPLPATGATVTVGTAAAGWWDGTSTLAQTAPAISEPGRCAALGDGWFAQASRTTTATSGG